MSFLSWFNKKPKVRLDFNDGPCLEIMSNAKPHKVVMLDRARKNQVPLPAPRLVRSM